MILLSCATLCAEGFTYQGFDRTFELLPAAGYRFVEFNLWHAPALVPSRVADLARRCTDAGLRASSVHALALGGASVDEFAKEVAYKIRMMQIARDLGCSMLSATGYPRGAAGGLDRIVEILRELMPVAEDMGLQVSLENHKNNNLEFIEDYERIFDAVPSASLGCCIDTGHFDASAVDMDALIDRIGPKVNHIHVKENKGVGVQQFTRFGEGTTDNHHIVRRMMQIGYQGFVVVEISPQKDRPNSVEDLRKPVEMFAEFAK